MSNSIVRTLVAKDLGINGLPLTLYGVIGVVAMVLLNTKNEAAFYVGFILLLGAVIAPGTHMVVSTIMYERKPAVLPFILSLPVSYMDYTKAKFLTNAIAFMVPWVLLISASVLTILLAPQIPDGLLPAACIILVELMMGFFILLAVALVLESEAWSVATMVLVNSTISLVMYFVFGFDEISRYTETDQIVWNSTALTLLGVELLIVAVSIALLFYLQSRKRDFL